MSAGMLAAGLVALTAARPGVEALREQLLFVLTGPAADQPFARPAELALDERRRVLYVADTDSHEIVTFSLQGAPADRFPLGPDFDPLSLVIDEAGNLHVADGRRPRIRVLDPGGGPQAEWSVPEEPGRDAPQLGRMVLDEDGRLYAVDRGAAQVLVFDRERRLQLRVGRRGNREGEFLAPEDVAVDRWGRICVTDSMGAPVQVFDAGGKYLYRMGRRGEQEDGLQFPTGLFIDRWDQLWVTDSHGHRVVAFDRFGRPRFSFGRFGQGRGQLYHPVDFALDDLDRGYVLEWKGRRAQVFRFDVQFGRIRP